MFSKFNLRKKDRPQTVDSQSRTSSEGPGAVATIAAVNLPDPPQANQAAQYVIDESALKNSTHQLPSSIFFEGVTEVGRNLLRYFPEQPPPNVPSIITMSAQKANHVSMDRGAVQWDLGQKLQKGDTGSGFGDDFCMVHGITRVFVLDPQNHVIAMVSPMRYLMFQAFQMYSTSPVRGNIFEFLKRAAAPRWAMRAAANQILIGQSGCIIRQGNTVSITGSYLENGQACLPEVVFQNIPYEGISWIVMDRWLEEAKSHKVSFVVAETGLHNVPTFDKSKTLPLVIREDEADMLMAQTVRNLTCKDERFASCRHVDANTLALQFREGWYAPKCDGITRIMRILKRTKDEDGVIDDQGSGRWKVVSAYSSDFDLQPSQHLWYIGGVDDIHSEALAKNVGTHLEMTLNLDSGGFQGSPTQRG